MEKKEQCEIVQDLLLGYVDNVLNEKSKVFVEKHLNECENCKKKLNEIKADIKENENNQNREIDYLKKIRRKSKIKSIILAIGIILLFCLTIYLFKFIKINNITSRAEKTLQANNYYKETTQILSDNQTSVTKHYYKDGKYKTVWEIYSDNGKEIYTTTYSGVDSEEKITFDENDKKVRIEKGEFVKITNKERNLKYVPFVVNMNENLIARLGAAYMMSIQTDTYDIGREYYVIKNQFETNRKLGDLDR